MSSLGSVFRQGQTLKAEELNLMVSAINDNDNRITSAKQTAENNARAIETINNRDVNISESEFERLQASGELDPNKNYYIYEE
jgi:hypothetical protein